MFPAKCPGPMTSLHHIDEYLMFNPSAEGLVTMNINAAARYVCISNTL